MEGVYRRTGCGLSRCAIIQFDRKVRQRQDAVAVVRVRCGRVSINEHAGEHVARRFRCIDEPSTDCSED
jgi:hypothetical protein